MLNAEGKTVEISKQCNRISQISDGIICDYGING